MVSTNTNDVNRKKKKLRVSIRKVSLLTVTSLAANIISFVANYLEEEKKK